jgi:hypothetical protein
MRPIRGGSLLELALSASHRHPPRDVGVLDVEARCRRSRSEMAATLAACAEVEMPKPIPTGRSVSGGSRAPAC